MNEAKHTPGPWEWTWEDASMQILSRAGDIGEGHVLAVTPCEACQKRNYRCLGPTEANARLIAAAPEMLAACESIATQEGLLRHHLTAVKGCEPLFRALSELKAAIAKAKGT